jgi:hypothetical protein
VLTIARSVQELRGREFKTSMISKTKTFAQMTFIFTVIGFLSAASVMQGSPAAESLIKYLHSDIIYYILLLITFLPVASGIASVFESNPKEAKNQTAKQEQENII